MFFVSCSTTKKQIKQSFDSSFFYDTGYFKIVLPLFTRDIFWNDTLLSLSQRGYVRLIDYKGPAGNEHPVYEITNEGGKYFLENYLNPSRDSDERFAIFKYYKLKNVKLAKYHFLNKKRDSAEVTFKSSYIVNPMFAVAANPLYSNAIFIRSQDGWKLQEGSKVISKIYRVDLEAWRFGGAFLGTDAYWRWRDNGFKK